MRIGSGRRSRFGKHRPRWQRVRRWLRHWSLLGAQQCSFEPLAPSVTIVTTVLIAVTSPFRKFRAFRVIAPGWRLVGVERQVICSRYDRQADLGCQVILPGDGSAGADPAEPVRWRQGDGGGESSSPVRRRNITLGGHSRTMPLYPELRPVLAESFEQAAEGAVCVVPERFRKSATEAGGNAAQNPAQRGAATGTQESEATGKQR